MTEGQQIAANRASRRLQAAKVNRFRRRAGRELDTALVQAGASLDSHPRADLFKAAISDAYRHPGSLRCMLCARQFATERPYAAFLLSCATRKPKMASLSAICAPCWSHAPVSEIEAEAERLLRGIVPGGRFDDAEAAS